MAPGQRRKKSRKQLLAMIGNRIAKMGDLSEKCAELYEELCDAPPDHPKTKSRHAKKKPKNN
jgi:hypothetical protein